MQVLEDLRLVVCGGGGALLDGGELRRDPVLLGFEEVEGDCSGEVGFEELRAFSEQSLLALGQGVVLDGGFALKGVELGD